MFSGAVSALLVPHLQCSLRDNPRFFQNFRAKNDTDKDKFLSDIFI
jgi:hypothetical protein